MNKECPTCPHDMIVVRTAGVEPASAVHESENARRTTIVYVRI